MLRLLLLGALAPCTLGARAFPVMPLPPLAVDPPTADDALAAAAPDAFEFVEAQPQCVNPIRDQGDCGSCWAFAASGSFADRSCVRGAPRRLLSPQDLLDCEGLNLGCTLGSLPSMAWPYLEKKGVATDACVPYSDPPGRHKCPTACADGSSPARRRATNATHLHGVAAIMAAVVEGPVDASFNVMEDFYEHWATGGNSTYVFTKGSPYKGLHSVKLVGFGVGADGVPYWTAENSWGLSGGFGLGNTTKGYFRIRRGTNECGFEAAVWAGWPAASSAAYDD
jgi:cathepsin B